MKGWVTAVAVGALLATCQRGIPEGFLGSAVVESQTYLVATPVAGQILQVFKQEGDRVTSGEVVALMDTTMLTLTLAEVHAGLAELDQLIAARDAELGSAKAETRGLAREYGRIGDLADKGSVPVQQKDDLGTRVQVADQRLKAGEYVRRSLHEKRKGVEARVAQLRDQLARCRLRAPCDGVVTVRYRNQGEVIGAGMPVLELGRYDTLQADFFVPQPMLALVSAGQTVFLRIDLPAVKGTERPHTAIAATVSWIAEEAEFTPKNIQTRDSRHELVFKVRAVAANRDGLLKAGLPVEVWKE